MQHRSHDEWRGVRSLPINFAVKADSDRLIILFRAGGGHRPCLV